MEFNCMIPELSARDFAKSLSFYTDVLGFHIEYQRPHFAFLSYQGSQIMLQQLSDEWQTGEAVYPFGRGINFQMLVDDIEIILTRLHTYGYQVMVAPQSIGIGKMRSWSASASFWLWILMAICFVSRSLSATNLIPCIPTIYPVDRMIVQILLYLLVYLVSQA